MPSLDRKPSMLQRIMQAMTLNYALCPVCLIAHRPQRACEQMNKPRWLGARRTPMRINNLASCRLIWNPG
jgi:hypothetical protein